MTQDLNEEAGRVEQLLRKYWQPYCETLDEEQVQNAISHYQTGGTSLYEAPHGGANFDVEFALKVAVEAATFISYTIKIYKQLMSDTGRKPSKSDLDSAIGTSYKAKMLQPVLAKYTAIIAAVSEDES